MKQDFHLTWSDGTYQPLDYFERVLTSFVASKPGQMICEIGAGANPALSLDLIAATDSSYVITDISPGELEKAPDGYDKVVVDITDSRVDIGGPYDLVMSHTVAEHISQPRVFHQNIYNLLSPDGRAVHMFPTLYSLPFVVNHVLPDAVSERVLKIIAPVGRESTGSNAKFPAHYRWCRGPGKRQINRFHDVGFEVERYIAFCGHRYYTRFPKLDALEQRIARKIMDHSVGALSSYAIVVLRKP